jgi:hypothetical protein
VEADGTFPLRSVRYPDDRVSTTRVCLVAPAADNGPLELTKSDRLSVLNQRPFRTWVRGQIMELMTLLDTRIGEEERTGWTKWRTPYPSSALGGFGPVGRESQPGRVNLEHWRSHILNQPDELALCPTVTVW